MRTEDNPEDALAEMTQAQAFVAHPYHWPVIGWMQEIQGLTLADALAYHASITRRKTRSWSRSATLTPTRCSSRSPMLSARSKTAPSRRR